MSCQQLWHHHWPLLIGCHTSVQSAMVGRSFAAPFTLWLAFLCAGLGQHICNYPVSSRKVVQCLSEVHVGPDFILVLGFLAGWVGCVMRVEEPSKLHKTLCFVNGVQQNRAPHVPTIHEALPNRRSSFLVFYCYACRIPAKYTFLISHPLHVAASKGSKASFVIVITRRSYSTRPSSKYSELDLVDAINKIWKTI